MVSNSFSKKRPMNRRPIVCTSKPGPHVMHCELAAVPDHLLPGTLVTLDYEIDDPRYDTPYNFKFRIKTTDAPANPEDGVILNGMGAQASDWLPINPGIQTATIVFRDALGNFV